MSNWVKITAISAYALPFTFVGGGFKTSYGPRTHLDNLLLRLHTDEGLTGSGEMCRITGSSPKPTAARSIAQVAERVPALIGLDPLGIQDLHEALGELPAALQNLRCAVDVAAWDLLGQRAALPLHVLLGGRARARMPVYASNRPGRAAGDGGAR